MKRYLFFVFILLTSLTSCRHEKAKAIIFERKELDGNRLLIRFKYITNNRGEVDSAVIANKVLNGDTISVSVGSKPPEIIFDKQ